MTEAWQLAQMNTGIMAQRRGFFEPPPKDQAYQVLWWVRAGVRPTVNDGLAFTFKQRFAAPGGVSGGELNPDGICVGWE